MWYQIFCTSKVLKFMISLKHPEIFLLSLALLFVSLPFFFAKTSSKYQKISFLTHSVSHLVQWLSQLLLFRYVKSHHSINLLKQQIKRIVQPWYHVHQIKELNIPGVTLSISSIWWHVFVPSVPLSAVKNMKVYDETSSTMWVRWEEADGATGYMLLYKSINATEPQLENEVK